MLSAAKPLLLILAALAPSLGLRAQAPVLRSQGTQLLVNGHPAFLVMASYFDALNACCLKADLDFLARHGIRGIRIMPNWFDGGEPPTPSPRTLFDARGQLQRPALRRLKQVLRQAAARGMIVDVTFTRETVPGLQMADYERAILAAVSALRRYPFVFYDLQNEGNGGNRRIPDSSVNKLRAAIHRRFPGVLVSASQAFEIGPEDYAAFVDRCGLDLMNYHSPRGGSWWRRTGKVTQILRRAGKPVYLGEPGRWTPGGHLKAGNLLDAVTAAKAAGAAAWTFHNEACFDLRDAPLAARLDSAVERVFLDSLPGRLAHTPWGP